MPRLVVIIRVKRCPGLVILVIKRTVIDSFFQYVIVVQLRL